MRDGKSFRWLILWERKWLKTFDSIKLCLIVYHHSHCRKHNRDLSPLNREMRIQFWVKHCLRSIIVHPAWGRFDRQIFCADANAIVWGYTLQSAHHSSISLCKTIASIWIAKDKRFNWRAIWRIAARFRWLWVSCYCFFVHVTFKAMSTCTIREDPTTDLIVMGKIGRMETVCSTHK